VRKTRGKCKQSKIYSIKKKKSSMPAVDLYKLQKVDKCLSSVHIHPQFSSTPPNPWISDQPPWARDNLINWKSDDLFFAVSEKGLFRVRKPQEGDFGGVSKRSRVVSSSSIVFTLADLSNPLCGISISYLTVFYARFFWVKFKYRITHRHLILKHSNLNVSLVVRVGQVGLVHVDSLDNFLTCVFHWNKFKSVVCTWLCDKLGCGFAGTLGFSCFWTVA